MNYKTMLEDVSNWQKAAHIGLPIHNTNHRMLKNWHTKQYPYFASEHKEWKDAETEADKIDGVFDTMWTLLNFFVWQENKLDEAINTEISINKNAKYNQKNPLNGIKWGIINYRTFTVLQHSIKQLDVMMKVAKKEGYNISEIWKIGSESNWAKFAKEEEDAMATVKYYQAEKGVKTNYQKAGEVFIIRVDGLQVVEGKEYLDTKIMKAGQMVNNKYIPWSEPDWSSALPEAVA